MIGYGDILRNVKLHLFGKKVAEATKQVADRIGLHAQREAKRNAPRSPTVAQISSTLIRKRRTARRAFPGGLEKSIEYEVTGKSHETQIAVFVPRNSAAGAYAKRIHDLKGIKWFKRGAGTIAKGDRADEKFIERAIKENESKYFGLLEKALSGAVKGV